MNQKIKTLRRNNVGEYVNQDFTNLLKASSIKRELIVPYASAQNGVTEHMNRILIDSVRSYKVLDCGASTIWKLSRNNFLKKV